MTRRVPAAARASAAGTVDIGIYATAHWFQRTADARALGAVAEQDRELPGHPVTDEELRALGFAPHDIQVRATAVVLPDGPGCEWTTLGDVPDAPGLYAFTVDDGAAQHVAYVGLTTHLWMVTKGRLPHAGGARPGERYGRPKYAGLTRQRVNVLVAAEVAAGRRVRHWLRPLPSEKLRGEEEALIRRWRLRECGWNRG